MEWKTIDIAPRDGKAVIIYDGLGVCAAYYSEDLNTWISNSETEEEHIHQPTHWMPLPPPPAE